MQGVLKIALGIVIGLLALVGLCSLCVIGIALLALAQATPTPLGTIPPADVTEVTPMATKATPTSGAMGQSVRYGSLLITPLGYQFGGAYKTKWGGEKQPPEGAKFLWVQIAVENVGENAVSMPSSSSFTVLHKGVEVSALEWWLKWSEEPADRPLYEGWEQIYPGVRREGWLRFTVPERAKAQDLLLVFQPESSFEATWRLGE